MRFRGQMQTIISKALGEVGIKPLPSRRCFSVMGAPPLASCPSLASCSVHSQLAVVFAGEWQRKSEDAQTRTHTHAPTKRTCAPSQTHTHTLAHTHTPSGLLEERLEKVYPADPRYSEKAATLFNLELGAPEVGLGSGRGVDSPALPAGRWLP